eukprot:5468388-Pleurochrysis_carterae.AAC.8
MSIPAISSADLGRSNSARSPPHSSSNGGTVAMIPCPTVSGATAERSLPPPFLSICARVNRR